MFLHQSIHLEVAERAARPVRAGDADDGLGHATGEGTSLPARELAQRLSGTDEVLLLWHPGTGRVELAVRDVETGVSFHLDVAPESAIDAFYHPYAYAARRKGSFGAARAEATGVNG
jgi:hypothetical protein